MAVLHITEAEFEEKVLKNEKPVFVDFYADWCGPCQMMKPILEEAANENPDVDFVAVDIEEAEMTAAKYGVMSIPNMVLFKNGEVADRIVGKTNKQNINKFVKN